MTDPAAVVSAMILRFECLTSSALMRGVLLAVAGSTEFGAQVSKQLLELLLGQLRRWLVEEDQVNQLLFGDKLSYLIA